MPPAIAELIAVIRTAAAAMSLICLIAWLRSGEIKSAIPSIEVFINSVVMTDEIEKETFANALQEREIWCNISI